MSLKDKVASNNKLLIAVSDACAGLDMTPEQFIDEGED